MGKEDYIAITHFINPQLFWYHKIDVQTAGFKELQRIEESVQLLYTAKQSAALLPYRPVVGEVIAIAFLSWNKFIRARVEYIAEYTKAEDEYVVWALDYGFPFRTKRIYVRKLPESHAMQTDHIRQGGIANIIPAEMEFDFLTTSNKLVCKRAWSKRPVELLEKVVSDAASISFIEMFAVNGGPSGTQYFGDLKIVNHMGEEFMASEYLIKLDTAMKCTNGFKEKLNNLKTTGIPCWQTNSGDMKIIENKLNSFNVDYAHRGSFNLSASLSGSSCDNFAKQKVMDWCQRNENLDRPEEDGQPIAPLNDLDASDLFFDDSVSVNNYKEVGLHMTYEDTFMGCAGALHESRRKKYEGKALPPKPLLEVFEVIPEKGKQSAEKKEKDNSGESTTSAPSVRTKALLELRKKRHKGSQKEQCSEKESGKEEASQKFDTQSESGTDEFLQICKEINAQSTRLAKLKELRKRRVEGICSSDQENNDARTNKDSCNVSEVKTESSVASVKSSRLLLLQKVIKQKHSKQFVDDTWEPSSEAKNKEGFSKQSESVVSSHASKLISLRKKVNEKNSRGKEAQLACGLERKLNELAIPDVLEKSKNVVEATNIDRANQPTFTEGNTYSRDVSKNQHHKSNMSQRVTSADDFTSTAQSSESNWSNDAASTHVSGAREVELQNMRQMIRSNPFQVMTMVPGGYDVTKLVKRNNEDEHWHTKKTTINDSSNSNRSSSAGYQNSNRSKDSSVGRQVPRRTEDVEEQNFRLTRSRKERKKPDTIVEEKNLLDASLTDDFVPPPTILPKTVSPKAAKEVPADLLLFIESEKSAEKDKSVRNVCKEEKLIDLSDNDINGDLLESNEVPLKDTPKEVASLVSHSVAEESFDLMNMESPEKVDSGADSKTMTQEDLLPNSSSPTSSTVLDRTITENVSPSRKVHTPKSTSISSSASSSSMQRLLKSPPVDDECSKLNVVGSYKHYHSSSSSSSSFVKINPDEAFIKETKGKTDAVSLPPVTSKWRDTASDRSSSSNSSTALSNKIRTSSPHPSAPTSESSGGSGLVRNEANARLPQVAGEASLKTNLIEHLVLAHSHAKVSPIENMTSAMFAPVVHREMENMRLTKMYRIQSYAWAHLIRGNSFFVVNPARTGKSWCYLPPICSMVNYRMESNELPQSYGPVAVIIAPSSVQVENISRQCRRLLASSATKISVVSSYAYRNSEDVKIELHNGCGILIITPPSLRRLLAANEVESLLNMERIQFVVLDDVDMMINHYSEFNETLQKFFGPVLRQESGKLHFQLVVTSKRWTRQMVKLLKISSQPMLCIGDFLEAAVYAKAKISIKLQSSGEKMSVMMKFLQKCSYSVERVVIVCNSLDEVDNVEKNLVEGGLACLPFTERTPVEYQNLIHEWKIKPISHEILVTMDSVLPELMIQNATILIHFSLPKSWTKFNFRFSVFLQKHQNIIKNAFNHPTEFVKSVVLLDEENNVQLPRLIEFMGHHDQSKYVHPDILNVAARVATEREEIRVKNGILMCPKVLEFGSCGESSRCPHRHQLTKYDVPLDGIPCEGEIRVKILDVLSPTHYIARLLTHKTEGTWKVVRRSNEVTRFLMQMLLHFTNDAAQVVHWPLRTNDMCVYKSDDTFHRCRILEVPPIVHENIVKVVNVKVKLIDSGSVIMCKSNALLVIPEKFVDFPAQAVDIRLSGVKPFDNERVWDTRSTRTVKSWIMTEVGENDSVQASVDFALMDTIWVQNIVLMEKLATIRGYALKVNVKRSLVGKEFGVADEEGHLVKKIAQQNGLLRPKQGDLSASGAQTDVGDSSVEENLMEFSNSISEEKDESRDSNQKFHRDLINLDVSTPVQKRTPVEVSDKPVEKWMRMGLEELNKIEIGEFKDPGKFFVRLTRQRKEFQDLESLIKEHNKDPLKSPHPMQNCLAPLDGTYHRAKIQRLEVDSSESEVRARVFFCDRGEFRSVELSELRCSSKELTEFLPFQAMTCKLTGVSWKSTSKEIQNLIPKNNCFYFAYPVKETPKTVVPDEDFLMHSYEIILYESLPEKYDVQVNKLLVEKDLAEYDAATKHFLENDSKATFIRANDDSDEEPPTIDFQQLLEHMQAILDEEDAENRREDEQQLVTAKAAARREEKENKLLEISDHTSDYSMVADAPKANLQIPALKSLYTCPRTTWYETMCMIYLVIHAPDITDYFLEVSPKRLMYSASVGGDLQVLVLDFLGYVEPELMTHEIRGLNVVVRLVKGVYMKWPRLLETATKYPWLTYNLDAIDVFQAEQMIETNTPFSRNRLTSISSETASSSSSNLCETFTPIVNYDQVYDPMQEMF